MRAREWTITRAFRESEEDDSPSLPAWHVRRGDCGKLMVADEDGESSRARTRSDPRVVSDGKGGNRSASVRPIGGSSTGRTTIGNEGSDL